ncbi:MAG: FAD:protein FMN transferase [Candidatus Dormibacteraeota bacterium]|nr:FAD:protein FMN transferase [Candidatus Dormibacteraeota bacterium]
MPAQPDPQQIATADDRALGTVVRLVVTRPRRLAVAKEAMDHVLRDIDQACSRFRDDSELSRLNAGAGREQTVSPLLARSIGAGLRAAQVTGGDVDPTVGTAMRLIGYDVDFASVAATGDPLRVTAKPIPGWRTVRLSETTRSVFIPRDVELDLGATAKALAADLAAAAALAALEGGGVLVSLGGDIALAGTPPTGGWTVQVSDNSTDPFDSEAERINLAVGAMATSSTRTRSWRRGSVALHHIIDPRTGAPVDSPWRLATVVAATCVDANTASTAAIVRGAAAVPWLEEQRLPSRLVGNDDVVVRFAGWPEPAARAED